MRFGKVFLMTAVGLVAFVAVTGSAEQGGKAPSSSPVVTSSQGCLVDPAVVEDIRSSRVDIEKLKRELDQKQAELAVREQALNEELKRIEEVRDQILGYQKNQERQVQERVAKLVETFENMSPKAASALLETLDEKLAVEAIAQISTQKLAKIMNVMEPQKSSRLTELLAGVARAKTSSESKGSAVATN